MAFLLTSEQIEEFHENGALCLRGVFSETWLEVARQGINHTEEQPSQNSGDLPTSTGDGHEGGQHFNDYCNWQHISELHDYAFNSPAKLIAAQLINSQYVVFYHEHVLTQQPGTAKVTPWHHDQAYYPVDGDKNCSIWMPIDNISMETSIEFLKGSHRLGWFKPVKLPTEKYYATDDPDIQGQHNFKDIPDIENNRHKYDILKWHLQPGDCIVFHMKTLHGAPSNTSQTPRRVISTRWLGDDCVLARRPWKTTPPIDGGLKYGDPMHCDSFPIVWHHDEYKQDLKQNVS